MNEEWAEDDELDTRGAPIGAPGIPQGPFGVPAVDPLVYQKSNDIPELRPAAAYVRTDQPLQVREAPPVAPSKREYAEWTPGGWEEPNPTAETESKSGGVLGKVLKPFFVLLAVVVPLGFLAYLVYAAISLYPQFR